jgi:hypothetical protein
MNETAQHIKTMTPRIFYRTNGGWNMNFANVRIPSVCPVCQGPRGQQMTVQFCEDGEWYNSDRWENPCGHIDKYLNVYEEHILFNANAAELKFKQDEPVELTHQQDVVVINSDKLIKIMPAGTTIVYFGYFSPSAADFHRGLEFSILKGIHKGETLFTRVPKELLNK